MSERKPTQVEDLSDDDLAWFAFCACEEVLKRICPDQDNRAAGMRSIIATLALKDIARP